MNLPRVKVFCPLGLLIQTNDHAFQHTNKNYGCSSIVMAVMRSRCPKRSNLAQGSHMSHLKALSVIILRRRLKR